MDNHGRPSKLVVDSHVPAFGGFPMGKASDFLQILEASLVFRAS